ncbi:hypothetical protein BDZ45DRAFT_738723 [Acephala macrosclerotiorum]|nr:hypothetical protein BDZ45DRAFT_738723 [Acephala macrosclerotiorum]
MPSKADLIIFTHLDSKEIIFPKKGSMKQWEDLISLHSPEFIWLRFMPPCGMVCAMMFPTKFFSYLLEKGERVGLTNAVNHAMRHGHIAAGGPTTGMMYLEPDLGSAYLFPSPGARRLEIISSFVEKDSRPYETCARSMLGSFAGRSRNEYELGILLEFEIEVVFMKPTGGTMGVCSSSEEPGGGCRYVG